MDALTLQLPLVALSGMLGSAHCLGMCGAISATMNLGARTVRASIARQTLWSLGRIFTYSFLGMVAGFATSRLTASQLVRSQGNAVVIQAIFAVAAGGLLIWQGLLATGWLKRRQTAGGQCLTASVFGQFLQGGSKTGVFIAGILTGFLPCGLVYSFLALAAATTSFWKGAVLMTAFGLGTTPVMIVAGAGLSVASLQLRQRLLKLAAICVLVTGILTTGRGIAFAVNISEHSPSEACPLCDQADRTP